MNQYYIAHRRKKDECNQSLRAHLDETSQFAQKFATGIGAECAGQLIGFLHDLGKASDEFNRYIKSATGLINPDDDDYTDAESVRGKIDHSTAGAQYVYRALADKGPLEKLAAEILSICIASHHSGLIDFLTPAGENNFLHRISKNDVKSHLSEALSNLDENETTFLYTLINNTSLVAQLSDSLQRLKEDADTKTTLSFKFGLFIKYLFSCLIDADRLSTADFEFPENSALRQQGRYVDWKIMIERLERRLNEFDQTTRIGSLRNDVSASCREFASRTKGLYQLTVPTGGGKTLASLRFALHHAENHRMDRIFYFIPFTSIIDQNAEEIRTLFELGMPGIEPGDIVLEHHSNLSPDEESRRQHLLAENWDSPIVFSTNVQFLEAWFGPGTRNMRRIHQLSNSVIIFDEVQTIPLRCVQMFNSVLRFLVHNCGATVVLSTATQPLLHAIEPKEYALPIGPEQEIIHDVQGLYSALKRVDVFDERKPGGWTNAEILELTERQLNTTGSVLLILNTKASAQDLYRDISQSVQCDVYHLSTNMCPAHRMDVLRKIKTCLELETAKPVICVSTQLIEAGIDIDFGTVIRSMAGLDSIAQAAGRCNRHQRRERGSVYIINIANEKLGKLRDITIAAEVGKRVLDEFKQMPHRYENDILNPQLMAQFYRYYFYDRQKEMNYPIGKASLIGRDDNMYSLLSSNNLSVQAYSRSHDDQRLPLSFMQSFASASRAFKAIDAPTRGIIVPYGDEGKGIINSLCSAFLLEKEYWLLRKAQRYSVNVFPHVFDKLGKNRAIREVQEGAGIFYLNEGYYSEEFGLSTDIVNEMESLIA